jgi:predicted alpha-1,2-mannosidase
MVTRRTFLGTLSLVACSNVALPRGFAQRMLQAAGAAGSEDVTRHVNIIIGTGGHGHCFPGATVPFGAVQLSPDTYDDGWDWCAGYHRSDTSIMGFSHTHLSGTGCGDLLDVLVMPRTGDVKLEPGTRENPDSGYRSRFSHDDETMEPGYYSVLLKDTGIRAELTATERTGFHQYTFPAQAQDAHFVVDLIHAYQSPAHPVREAELTIDPENRIVTGGRTVESWAPGRQIYFAMEFSAPFTKAQLYSNRRPIDSKTTKGNALQAVLHLDSPAGKPVQIRCGISAVSAANALKNLRAEQTDWDFAATRAKAKAAWQQQLSRMRIDGATPDQQAIFYSSLYHMMCAPTLMDDVTGEYRGMDNQVHTLAAGEHNYSSYSLWDTYRACHPSYTLFQPERVPSLVNCLIAMAEQSPAGMPVWPLQAEETGTMTGYHSASVMAEACVKNFPGIDWDRAYKVMRKRNMDDDYRGLALYRKDGYIPADLEEESVSKTLEYNYGDWACSHVAKKLGRNDDVALQLKRSQNYQHLFDRQTLFIRAKLANGEWATPFDPKEMGHSKRWRDYTESNAWQTTFGIQHDVKGLIDQFGGREPFLKKLDDLFNQSSELPADAPPDIAGLIGQYAHGNEPSHHIAYLYIYAGQPWKTQERIRQILDTLYHNDPDGLAGNEDCGQMSAWYVMSALGLYSVDPVSGTYVLGTPLFESSKVNLAGGKTLSIEARRTSPSQKYVQSVALNGKPLDRLWVHHSELIDGATLTFTMGDQPNQQLGADPKVAPPSLTA